MKNSPLMWDEWLGSSPRFDSKLTLTVVECVGRRRDEK